MPRSAAADRRRSCRDGGRGTSSPGSPVSVAVVPNVRVASPSGKPPPYTCLLDRRQVWGLNGADRKDARGGGARGPSRRCRGGEERRHGAAGRAGHRKDGVARGGVGVGRRAGDEDRERIGGGGGSPAW